jgi:hypothetical protein
MWQPAVDYNGHLAALKKRQALCNLQRAGKAVCSLISRPVLDMCFFKPVSLPHTGRKEVVRKSRYIIDSLEIMRPEHSEVRIAL